MQICNPILPNRYAFNIVYRFGKIGNILHIPLIVSIKKIPGQYFLTAREFLCGNMGWDYLNPFGFLLNIFFIRSMSNLAVRL